MKISIPRNELIKSLARVQGIVERRNTLPILSYVLVSAEKGKPTVELQSTDLEVALKASYEAKITEPGSVTLMAKKAFEIARELPEGDVEISSDEKEWVKLKSGKATFRMVGLPKEDFPDMPARSQRGGLTVARKTFVEMIQKTSFAISHDQTRYALNGVYVELTAEDAGGGRQLCRMVSTDGHRLAMIERPCLSGCTEGRSVIVPRKAVLELRKVMEDEASEESIRIDVQENHIFVVTEKLEMGARLIEGQFPEYSQVIPKESKRTATVAREEFARVLKRISILTADRSSPVKFKFDEGKMTISTATPDVGEAVESMDVGYEGEPIELGFNARYVLDVLGAVPEELMVLRMNEPLSPGLFTVEGDEGYRYVVMPMRL